MYMNHLPLLQKWCISLDWHGFNIQFLSCLVLAVDMPVFNIHFSSCLVLAFHMSGFNIH